MMAYEAIPYDAFNENPVHFWVHYGLVILGFILAVITAIAQWVNPAPYGKHSREDMSWGPGIPQRFSHMLTDGVPGVLMFLLVFFLYGEQREAVNIVFLILFELHYIHRGILHPIIMRYSSAKVPVGITLGGIFPNIIYHFINADWIGSANYVDNYYYDIRFLLGVVIFIVGFIINRWADFKLRSLRKPQREYEHHVYHIPYGGLFELVTCPNYFGELVQWIGWALATWSLAGLVWCLFTAATFVPRSRHNHQWYQERFEDYPPNRKALIPYVF